MSWSVIRASSRRLAAEHFHDVVPGDPPPRRQRPGEPFSGLRRAGRRELIQPVGGLARPPAVAAIAASTNRGGRRGRAAPLAAERSADRVGGWACGAALFDRSRHPSMQPSARGLRSRKGRRRGGERDRNRPRGPSPLLRRVYANAPGRRIVRNRRAVSSARPGCLLSWGIRATSRSDVVSSSICKGPQPGHGMPGAGTSRPRSSPRGILQPWLALGFESAQRNW